MGREEFSLADKYTFKTVTFPISLFPLIQLLLSFIYFINVFIL